MGNSPGKTVIFSKQPYNEVRSSERGSSTSSPLWSTPDNARSRHGPVESYNSASVSTVETRTPGSLRCSLPVVTPSARTKNAGYMLCGADEFEQLIHTWLHAAAVVMAAGIVIPG